MAGDTQALLHGWMVEGIFHRTRGKRRMVEHLHPSRVHGVASAAGACRPACGILRGNDGVGIADGTAASLHRVAQRVRKTARSVGVIAWRSLARILSQVS